MGKEIVNILKRVDDLEQKNSKYLSSSWGAEQKESVHTPQFMFQDKNTSNVYNHDTCDKIFNKKPKLKIHIDKDNTHCLLC